MGTQLVYNTSTKPLYVHYDGRSVIIQPKNAGTYEFQRFGVTDDPAPDDDVKAGLFFEDADTGEKRKVVPKAEYQKGQYPKITYGNNPDYAVTRRAPRYCQIAVRVSKEDQDGCAEVSDSIAAHVCSADFARKHGVRCYRGTEIASQLRSENARLAADLEAKAARLAELEKAAAQAAPPPKPEQKPKAKE